MARRQPTRLTRLDATDRTRLVAGAGMVAFLGGLTAIVFAGSGSDSGQSGETVAATRPIATVPSAPPRPATVRISLTGVSAYDPQGDGTENNADAGLATDGNGATAWKSEQ